MQTVAEFRSITLMRKAVIGFIETKERRRQKTADEKKAEDHLQKVKANQKQMKIMLDNFRGSEYGIVGEKVSLLIEITSR